MTEATTQKGAAPARRESQSQNPETVGSTVGSLGVSDLKPEALSPEGSSSPPAGASGSHQVAATWVHMILPKARKTLCGLKRNGVSVTDDLRVASCAECRSLGRASDDAPIDVGGIVDQANRERDVAKARVVELEAQMRKESAEADDAVERVTVEREKLAAQLAAIRDRARAPSNPAEVFAMAQDDAARSWGRMAAALERIAAQGADPLKTEATDSELRAMLDSTNNLLDTAENGRENAQNEVKSLRVAFNNLAVERDALKDALGAQGAMNAEIARLQALDETTRARVAELEEETKGQRFELKRLRAHEPLVDEARTKLEAEVKRLTAEVANKPTLVAFVHPPDRSHAEGDERCERCGLPNGLLTTECPGSLPAHVLTFVEGERELNFTIEDGWQLHPDEDDQRDDPDPKKEPEKPLEEIVLGREIAAKLAAAPTGPAGDALLVAIKPILVAFVGGEPAWVALRAAAGIPSGRPTIDQLRALVRLAGSRNQHLP